MSDSGHWSTEGALAEFSALRNEALQAFSMQWNTVALQLTATSVVFSFALTNRARNGFLLIIPVVAYILNGRYLRSQRTIRLISSYIVGDLSPRVPGGLNWEAWLRSRPSPRPLVRWSAHGPLIFSVISIVSLVWVAPYILSANKVSTLDRYLLAIIWILGLTLTSLSLYTIKIVFTEDRPLRDFIGTNRAIQRIIRRRT
jgi:hypothetical protein